MRELFARIDIKHNKRNRMVIGLVAVLVIGSGLGWFYLSTRIPDSQSIALKGMRADYEAMKQKGPTSSSVTERAEYYLLLASKAADAQRYDEAIEAFDSRAELLGDKMPPTDYAQKAVFHCRAKDKDAAIDALNFGANLKQANDGDRSRLSTAKKLITEKGCDSWLAILDNE